MHVFKIPPRVTSGGYRAGDWKDEVRVFCGGVWGCRGSLGGGWRFDRGGRMGMVRYMTCMYKLNQTTNKQVWQGSLKVVQKGQDAAVLLIDPKTSESMQCDDRVD